MSPARLCGVLGLLVLAAPSAMGFAAVESPACILLRASAGTAALVLDNADKLEGCDSDRALDVEMGATGTDGWGLVRLVTQTPLAQPSLSGGGVRGVHVHALVHASWPAGCTDARAEVTLRLDRKTLDPVAGVPITAFCDGFDPSAVDPAPYLAVAREVAALAASQQPWLGASLDALLQAVPDDAPVVPLPPTPLASPPVDPVSDHPEVDAAGALGLDVEDQAVRPDFDASLRAGEASVDFPGALRPDPAAPPEAEARVVEPAPSQPPESGPAPVAPSPAPPPARAPPPALPAPAPATPLETPRVTVQSLAPATPTEAPRREALATLAAVGTVLLVAASALYQRVGKPRALTHPARGALYAASVALGRGATSGELAASVGIERKTAEHHLRYLSRLGLLREASGAGGRRLFLPPMAEAPEAEVPLPQRLRALVRAHPGLSVGEIAQRTGLKYGRVERALKELLLMGPLESRVDAGERRYYPTG